MKLTGFNLEIDTSVITKEHLLLQLPIETIDVTYEEKIKVANYIKNADNIMHLLLPLTDGENHVGFYSIQSDGEWIWPSHLSYYFQKDSKLNATYLESIRSRGYKPCGLLDMKKHEILHFFEKEVLNYRKRN
jgi:hypothetical protein